MKKKVIVASINPVKINAVKLGFQKMFSKEDFEFEGISVASGVRDQPMSDSETLQGAINRVRNTKVKLPMSDYWVGIEGGIDEQEEEMEAFAWIVVQSAQMNGKARTGAFYLPKEVVKLIKAGKELGEADDIVFGDQNSKQKGGAVGLLTDNVLSRTSLYEEAVILALIPFKHESLY